MSTEVKTCSGGDPETPLLTDGSTSTKSKA